MKGGIPLPDHFMPYEDILLWDEYGEIREEIKQAIYMKPYFCFLTFIDGYFCQVYWNDDVGYWCGELHGDGKYLGSYICESLPEIKDEILEEYPNLSEE
jgi:hypothetical protein